jgi:predicted secreted protein
MSYSKKIVLFAIAITICMLSGSCTTPAPATTSEPKEVQITQVGGACGSGVGLNQGDTLVLVMDGDSSPDYIWEIGFYVPAVIKPVDEQESQSDSAQFGSSENNTFRFLAVGEGQAELLLIYKPVDTDLADPEQTINCDPSLPV